MAVYIELWIIKSELIVIVFFLKTPLATFYPILFAFEQFQQASINAKLTYLRYGYASVDYMNFKITITLGSLVVYIVDKTYIWLISYNLLVLKCSGHKGITHRKCALKN